MREAMHYRLDGEYVVCELCPHFCKLKEGQSGICRGRMAQAGKLIATNYSRAVTIALDPIEKKPLYQYHPGSRIISLGPNSCNLSCSFCQNWQISQTQSLTKTIAIHDLKELCLSHEPHQVAFTYSEPLMWFEYIHDFSLAAPEIEIVLVTNAYLNATPFAELLPMVKAMNIDLKSINDNFYRELCNAGVEVVKNNIKSAYRAGIHLEITNLLIPGYNDSEDEIRRLAEFIASVDERIPLHISAYHPDYKLSQRATTSEEIELACTIASSYLNYVYAGNVYSAKFGNKA
jgi:pyruvate formate lyase activating enzyme